MNRIFMKLSHDQRDQGQIPQKFEVIFVGFRLKL